MYFFFIKRLGVVSWTGLGTWVLDLAKIPDQIAVPLSACLFNSGSKIKAIILTIEKKNRDRKLEMVLLLLRRKGRRALFWPVGLDSWWVWGYNLHDPPMTLLHLVHGGLDSHCCEGKKPISTHPWSHLHIDSSLKSSPPSPPRSHLFFSLIVFLSHLWKVLPLPFLVDLQLWAFVFSPPNVIA